MFFQLRADLRKVYTPDIVHEGDEVRIPHRYLRGDEWKFVVEIYCSGFQWYTHINRYGFYRLGFKVQFQHFDTREGFQGDDVFEVSPYS